VRVNHGSQAAADKAAKLQQAAAREAALRVELAEARQAAAAAADDAKARMSADETAQADLARDLAAANLARDLAAARAELQWWKEQASGSGAGLPRGPHVTSARRTSTSASQTSDTEDMDADARHRLREPQRERRTSDIDDERVQAKMQALESWASQFEASVRTRVRVAPPPLALCESAARTSGLGSSGAKRLAGEARV
jgi:hypothetical protein